MSETHTDPQKAPTDPPFDEWGIVEVMGHQAYAGRITSQTIAGASFVRVDVPQTERSPGFTKLLGTTAIFAITPTTKEIAEQAAANHRHFDQIALLGTTHDRPLLEERGF